MNHTKEQLRSTALDVIFKRVQVPFLASHNRTLAQAVAYVLAKQENRRDLYNAFHSVELSEHDRNLFDEVFWDLVIERVIVPGANIFETGTSTFRVRSDASSDTK